jgi:hypothetical protein
MLTRVHYIYVPGKGKVHSIACHEGKGGGGGGITLCFNLCARGGWMVTATPWERTPVLSVQEAG